jgi:hypothetical protein
VEDKTFELLTKLYGEFTEFRQETRNDINGLKNDVIRLENKLDNHSKALFDGYHQMYEKLEVVDDKLDALREKVDRHDIKIRVIEGGRKQALFIIRHRPPHQAPASYMRFLC